MGMLTEEEVYMVTIQYSNAKAKQVLASTRK